MDGRVSIPDFGKWGDDIRMEMLRSIVGQSKRPTQRDADAMLRTVAALADVVSTRPRSVVPGFGTFEWHLFRKRLPDGKRRRCVSVVFRIARRCHDTAREIYSTGKARSKSAVPGAATAAKATTRRGK